MNPNTPVIIGVGQILQRADDIASAKEPIELMVDAAREAAEDAGVSAHLQNLDSVRVVRGRWRYKQPAGFIADQLNVVQAETMGTPFGGNSVQALLSESAANILAGKNQFVLLSGAETGRTQARYAKQGEEMPYRETGEQPYDRMLGEEMVMAGDEERRLGIQSPIQVYPIFENAIRYQRGETIAEHQARIAKLWSGFSEVAAGNPNAWIRDPVTPEALLTPSAVNRHVSFPYHKLLNSNNAVDMGAGILMCSVSYAKKLGVPESKWVYPWSGANAHDTYAVSNRDNLYSSPAIRMAGKKALALAEVEVSDLARVDVYSCFPSAVQVAVNELGLDDSKPLTITGGLTFGGGPLNNYVMHSIARMVELSREDPDGIGLITANGGYLTKHAFGVYSATPPAFDFRFEDVQAAVDQTPTRDVAAEFSGQAEVESYTVMYQGDQPAMGHLALRTSDGRRAWANMDNADCLQAMISEECCGRKVTVSEDSKAVF